MDVLYRVRPGPNEELRYSLRSLANVPHGEVFMVGHPPEWVRNVTVITPRRLRTKFRALVADLALACAELKGRRLLLIDDDMYILKARKSVEALHAGDLREQAQRKVGAYSKTMTHTADYLNGIGIGEPVSYELHIPLEIDAEAMAGALQPVEGWRRPVQARSVYGNVVGIKATQAEDVKLDKGPMPTDYLSTSPQSWRYWRPHLHALFPQPSEYEQ